MVVAIGLPSCASRQNQVAANPYTSSTTAPPKPSFIQNCLAKIPNIFPKKRKPPTASPPQWTGVIRMVNSAENFVLVESNAMSSAIPGETYLSVGRGVETASLRMTSLRNPPFLIADILTGNPSPGDKIYLPSSSSAAAGPAPKAKPPKKQKASPSKKQPAPAPSPRQTG